MISLLVLLAATSIDANTIRISAQPQPVWIEQKGSYQSLNFDLVVDNPTDAPLDVDEIKLSVYDRKGSLVLQKLIDGNGTRPSIRTIDVAGVAPKAKTMIFNPFERFERDLDLASLVYDVKLSGKEGSPLYSSRLVVEPRPYVTKTNLILQVSTTATASSASTATSNREAARSRPATG